MLQNNSELQTIINKLQTFCAYRERCTKDVKDKLKKLKVDSHDFNKIISQLQNDNFLNDERYTKAFINDKLKFSKFGKIKIRYELLKKQIPSSIINSSLSQISDSVYINIIKELIAKKTKEINQPASYQGRYKLFSYLKSRGFENDIIFKFIDLSEE